MANEPASPHDLDEFPDVPAANKPGGSEGIQPEDKPDLDRFADRLGIGEAADGRAGDDIDKTPVSARAGAVARSAATRSRSFAAACLGAISATSGRLADRVRPGDT